MTTGPETDRTPAPISDEPAEADRRPRVWLFSAAALALLLVGATVGMLITLAPGR